MKIMDYPKVPDVAEGNILVLDGDNGTKYIPAKDLAMALLKKITAKEYLGNISLSALTEQTAFNDEDSLLVETSSGIKKISMANIAYTLLDPVIPIETRNNLWRGKNLGSEVTPDQYEQIKNATFRDMFLGDYWNIEGRIWRIVDIDYWWGTGDTGIVSHHLVIMPDYQLYTATMNDTDDTTGAYVGSKMYTENLNRAKELIKKTFGEEHILVHREFLQNAVTDGRPTAAAWCDSTVELPNEIMMYGSYIFTSANNGVLFSERSTIDKSQLSAMRNNPKMISPQIQTTWLRDVASTQSFAVVNGDDSANCHPASGSHGVRPVFGLIG